MVFTARDFKCFGNSPKETHRRLPHTEYDFTPRHPAVRDRGRGGAADKSGGRGYPWVPGERPKSRVPWAVHLKGSARRLCEAKGHVEERSVTAIRVEHPHEVIQRADDLATHRLPDDGIQHRVLLLCHRRLSDPECPEHLPDPFAKTPHQETAIAGGDQNGKERPVAHAEDKLGTGKEQMGVPVAQRTIGRGRCCSCCSWFSGRSGCRSCGGVRAFRGA